MNNLYDVTLTRQAEKDIKKIPEHVLIKLLAWIEEVGNNGIHETRKVPGYHDEPLKGKRKGQQSIRLSKSYHAIYIMKIDNSLNLINVIEVNKHGY